MQAAQQVVQNQAAQKDDQSPEKTRPTMRTMVVKDIRGLCTAGYISSFTR